MPGVTKDGKPAESYGYDIGGKSEAIKHGGSEETAPHKFPAAGNLGKLDRLNTDRFYERPGRKEVSSVMGKTGYESTSFDKNGNVKNTVKTDVKFLESDGSWAPAEGRGSTSGGTVMKRGKYSNSIMK